MANVKDIIKEFVEERTYQSRSNFTFNYRVEQVGDNDYEVYIINSYAEVIYLFADVTDDTDQYTDPRDAEYAPFYSAKVSLVSCKIYGFEADEETSYYLDGLRRYMEQCEMVEYILDSIPTYFDPEVRTNF